MTGARVVDGRYRLTEKIGHGGMGQVWAGHDQRLDRRVAVKLLRTDLLGPEDATRSRGDELRRRFLRESRISAALDHPGLVTVFDAGTDGGELYLVMQQVPGVSLADLLAEDGPLTVERAAATAAQLCSALAAVHAVPVVHRDLKPSNVMIRPDGRTVLLDLGIATALDPDATRLTLTGTPIGSPAYMAPEQALAAGVDPRSDLYALGCLLHEMLTGDAPFTAPTALGVLRRHVDEPPPPLRELRPDVPAALERLVLALLAKQPADRPADAQQVHAVLQPLLPGPSAGPQPPHGPLPDPARPYRHPHHPAPARTAAPPPTRLSLPDPAPPADPAPVLMAAVASRGAEPDGDLTAACARLSDLVAAHRHTEVVDLAAGLLPRIAAAHGDGAPLLHTVRTIRARTLLQEGRAEEALAEYRLLAAATAAERGPYDPAALDHRQRAADCLERLGRTGEALAEYRELTAALPPDSDRSLEVRERTGRLLTAAGDHDGAWHTLLELLLDTERRRGPHHADVRRLRALLDRIGALRTATPLPGTTRPAVPPTLAPPPPAGPPGTARADPRLFVPTAPPPTPVPGNPYAAGG
ncbi:serine/threonine-protein kinase [Streptomyces sp. NRRL B-24484]|uniref:serine/threonine-protein kinase n=1 Tax=Streptomyces sp. NRRL B-24484 TaxID=1463833 RepID=UPI0007C455D9|nr:serine/threonine-protein kinase [Streptomyces sp. NRRL B-24484]